MECIEIEARALKPSFLVKANSKLFQNDDVWCFAGINSVRSDDFPVEELLNLDFPEKDTQELSFSRGIDEPKAAFHSHLSHSSSNFFGADEFDSLSASVPVDDVENLEWLSQFVDDSALDFKEGDGVPVEPLHIPVHRKPRSKRSKPQRRAWSSPPSSAAEQSFVSSSGSTSAFVKPVAEKQRRKSEGGAGSASGRRCSHCQVQKTPQWRTGPVGPKTLCNACGVRFKSGRLFPEYRPACSPTFLQDLHSNSHRKVLEMRLKVFEPGLQFS